MAGIYLPFHRNQTSLVYKRVDGRRGRPAADGRGAARLRHQQPRRRGGDQPHPRRLGQWLPAIGRPCRWSRARHAAPSSPTTRSRGRRPTSGSRATVPPPIWAYYGELLPVVELTNGQFRHAQSHRQRAPRRSAPAGRTWPMTSWAGAFCRPRPARRCSRPARSAAATACSCRSARRTLPRAFCSSTS